MFKFIRNIISLLMFTALAYACFTINVAGQTVVEHVLDVYQSQVVQTKLTAVKQELQQRLDDQLNDIKRDAIRKQIPDDYSEQEKAVIEDAIVRQLDG